MVLAEETITSEDLEKCLDRITHEFALKQAIKERDLDWIRSIFLESNHLQFNEGMALRILEIAIDLENELYVQELIPQCGSLDNQKGGELIWRAMSLWNPKISSMLIEAGANVNVCRPTDLRKKTLLQYIASLRNNRKEYYDLALLLLDHGAFVDATSLRGNTALHYAVSRYKRVDKYSFVLAIELVHRGARVDSVNNSGDTPIDIAMKNHWFDGQLCPLLIALAKVDNDTKCRWIVKSLVSFTEKDSNPMGVKSLLLLDYPISKIRGCAYDTWRSLYFTVANNRSEQLELLLECGLDINFIYPYFGQAPTLLHLALNNNMTDIIKILVSNGADIHATNDVSREFPIHAACRSAAIENIRLMLRLGANVNTFDRSGKSPYALITSTIMTDHLRQCFIEHFAILKARGIWINRGDWRNIHREHRWLNYFKRCIKELEKMKTIFITADISLFRIIVESGTKVSGFARNSTFIRNYREHESKIKNVFPLYFDQLEYKMKMAETRSECILPREEILSSLITLPHVVIQRIIEFACYKDLYNFERLYHVSKVKT